MTSLAAEQRCPDPAREESLAQASGARDFSRAPLNLPTIFAPPPCPLAYTSCGVRFPSDSCGRSPL
jgi:hypothetical protein